MKKNLNLIIDLNNMFMRSLHTCQFISTGIEISNFDTDQECNALVQKTVSDLTYIVRLFAPDRVVLVCDSKNPWRNKIYDDIPGEKYKGTREKDKSKNWNKIFATYDEIKSILSARNFIVSDIPLLEGDDLAALWKDYFFALSEDVILVTSDRDWHQLISFDKMTEEYCICYNPTSNNQGKKKLYVNKSMEDWLNSADQVDIFFRNFSVKKKKIRDLCDDKYKIVMDVINPDSVLLEKIMCGDDIDNIPAFFDYYRNGKKVRITPLKSKHILESTNITNVNQLIESANNDQLKAAMEKEMKREIEIDFPGRLARQRHLVELNQDMFPTDCVESFKKHVLDTLNRGYVSTSIKMEDVLGGTKYINMEEVKRQSRDNSIFDDLKSLSKYSKPLF